MPNSNFIRIDLSLQPITTQKVMRKAILIALTAVNYGQRAFGYLCRQRQ